MHSVTILSTNLTQNYKKLIMILKSDQ